MRLKEDCVVITFASTTDAMAAELFFNKKALRGRLIPVPTSITAGCGMAWKAPAEDRDVLLAALSCEGLRFDKDYRMLI